MIDSYECSICSGTRKQFKIKVDSFGDLSTLCTKCSAECLLEPVYFQLTVRGNG